jgi:hypothetical protein
MCFLKNVGGDKGGQVSGAAAGASGGSGSKTNGDVGEIFEGVSDQQQ